jgi:hypothetical protein
MFFVCVDSYIISQECFLCYNIQQEINVGYQRGGNSPHIPTRNTTFSIWILCSYPNKAIELIPEVAPRHRRQRRGIRIGILVRLRRRAYHPPLLSILLANVQSMDKVDELRARISFQRDIRDWNILCFTESWLSPDILSPSIHQAGFSVHCADSNKELSGKKKGRGVYFMMNYSWCDYDNVQKTQVLFFTQPRIPHNQMPTILHRMRILFGYS